MKKTIIIGVVAAIILGLLAFYAVSKPLVHSPPPVTSSTQESGAPPSASGTAPPPPLPISSGKGTVNGSVILGPICPVEQIPPNPNCAPKPYRATIRIQAADQSGPYASIPTNASGTFSVLLSPGTYIFHAQNQNNSYYPRCTDAQVKIAAGTSQSIVINCDTGIR